MASVNDIYQQLGELNAQAEFGSAERSEMKSDIKAILAVVSPLPAQIAEMRKGYAEHDLRLKSLESTREASRARARLAKRVGGWAVALLGTGFGVTLLRKLGIDIPDGN